MEFKAYLKSVGLTDEQVENVVKGMPENKFYLATEEKLDERYAKAKEQKAQIEAELTKANELVESLKQSQNPNEELQAKLSEYETQVNELTQQRLADNKNAAIELALTKSGARNIKAVKALLDLDNIKATDSGYDGLEEQLKTIQEQNDYLFQQTESKVPTVTTGGNPPSNENQNKTMAQILGLKS